MTVFENDGLIECKNNQCTLKPGNKGNLKKFSYIFILMKIIIIYFDFF